MSTNHYQTVIQGDLNPATGNFEKEEWRTSSRLPIYFHRHFFKIRAYKLKDFNRPVTLTSGKLFIEANDGNSFGLIPCGEIQFSDINDHARPNVAGALDFIRVKAQGLGYKDKANAIKHNISLRIEIHSY